MIQIINGNYIRRTSSGVMKLGSAPSFGSKAKNAEWDKHFKEVDAKMKADKTAHGIWSNRPFWDGVERRRINKKVPIRVM